MLLEIEFEVNRDEVRLFDLCHNHLENRKEPAARLPAENLQQGLPLPGVGLDINERLERPVPFV